MWTPALDVELGALTAQYCFDFEKVAAFLCAIGGADITEEACRLRWAELDTKADLWNWSPDLDDQLKIYARKCVFDFKAVAVHLRVAHSLIYAKSEAVVTADQCQLRYSTIDAANVVKRTQKSGSAIADTSMASATPPTAPVSTPGTIRYALCLICL
jgi:hypothetical protein